MMAFIWKAGGQFVGYRWHFPDNYASARGDEGRKTHEAAPLINQRSLSNIELRHPNHVPVFSGG